MQKVAIFDNSINLAISKETLWLILCKKCVKAKLCWVKALNLFRKAK